MSIAIKATFWCVTCGGVCYMLFNSFKPDAEYIKKIEGLKHTESSKSAKTTWDVIKLAADPNSDISKKVDDLIKKGK